MAWEGNKIKTLSKDRRIPITMIAKNIGVSRQSVTDWINGQVPNGMNLISLCKTLEVTPGYFFSDDTKNNILMPIHKMRKKAKTDQSIQKDAMALAEEYEILFRNISSPSVVPVIRIVDRSEESAIEIAQQLRKLSGIPENEPLDYEHAFKLLQELGIVTIFRYFPHNLKTYAFYTKIFNHRVVFINNHTNILDLIFPLLHEAVHAIRDEVYENGFYDEGEENFCDDVANYTQFPNSYIEFVHQTIKGLKPGQKINKLKMFGEKYSHSLYGIVKRIKSISRSFSLNVGGADTNLKKEFHSIGEIIFQTEDPVEFIDMLEFLSPKLIKILRGQINNISNRKLGELLDINSGLDGKDIKNILSK